MPQDGAAAAVLGLDKGPNLPVLAPAHADAVLDRRPTARRRRAVVGPDEPSSNAPLWRRRRFDDARPRQMPDDRAQPFAVTTRGGRQPGRVLRERTVAVC